MSANNPMDVFVHLLSDVRRKTERSIDFYKEVATIADEPQVKEAVEARAFVAQQSLQKIDQAFALINQTPVELTGRLEEVFVEDFRRELGELKSPLVRRLFVLSKLVHLAHFRIGEYVALVAAADITGHFGVGVLLETCLGENLAFVERTRRLIRKMAEAKIAATAKP